MSFPRYPKYKPSGVEWFGEVPEGWEVKPLFGCAVERSESNKGMLVDNLLSLSYGRIIAKDLMTNEGLLPESFETYQIVRRGDIVLRLTDLQNDKRSLRSALVEEDGIITSAYLAVSPRRSNATFMAYLFRAYDLTKVFYSMGGGVRQTMKFADMKRLPTVLPPLPEQTAIAEFLDRETAKIDGLVAEQRRLMELLKEKRQAVISHAVTKGLNPHAPMKPSGIEWLGDVPEGWSVAPFKRQIARNDGGVWGDDPDGISDTIVLRSTEQTVDGRWQLDNPASRKLSEPDIDGALLDEGDLLLTKSSGSSLHIGKTTLVTAEIAEMRCCYSNFMQRIRTKPTFLPKLAWYFLNNQLARQQLDLVSNSTTGLANLNATMVGQLVVIVPPFPEQTAIVGFLETELLKFDTLTAEAQRAIDLLQERRTALISAAVTGQIDVRQQSRN